MSAEPNQNPETDQSKSRGVLLESVTNGEAFLEINRNIPKTGKGNETDNCDLLFANEDKCFLCQEGFSLSNDSKCLACPKNCVICTSPRFCVRCKTGYSNYFDETKGEILCMRDKVYLYLYSIYSSRTIQKTSNAIQPFTLFATI